MKTTNCNLEKSTDRIKCFLLVMAVFFLTPTASMSTSNKPDSTITNQVKKEIILDPSVSLNQLNIKTENGIVLLTGTVHNLLSKERAALVAESIQGVRSVVNRIEIERILDRTGPELHQAVNNALHYDAATEAYEIDIQADKNGSVTLAGTVDSWQEKELVETVAKSVSGVVKINNNIDVNVREDRPNQEIKAEIEKKLYWDNLVDDSLIHVQVVDDGKVTLTGTVGSVAELRRTDLNAWVAGVNAVDSSELKIKEWAEDTRLRKHKYVTKPDNEIKSAIQDAFLYDPRINAFNLDVTVDDGRVILKGVVDNIQAKKSAERNAKHTIGVLKVDNEIKVKPLADLSASTISDNIRKSLMNNPFTERHEIKVSANNHTVKLSGIVETHFEKAEAENVAYRSKGVGKVINEIKVRDPASVKYNPYAYDWSIFDYPWYTGTQLIQSNNDKLIEKEISSELFWSPFVDKDQVNVDVDNGVAILTGTVDSMSEYNAARENAFEGGAVDVINNLKLR